MVIRDPIHRDIELTPLQAYLLDAAEVQRLRGIRQTGTAYLVYPGCVHTRFEHSLGTLAAANRILAGLRRSGVDVSRAEQEAIGAAALLHDVTHVPFGHTFEDERGIFPRHDSGHRFAAFFQAGDLGGRLRAAGLDGLMAEWFGPAAASSAPDWRRDVVGSCIDADLLDYLRRDARFAGLAQDYDDRVYQAFGVESGRLAVQMVKHDMDRPDVRSEVVNLLRLRYFLTERVYFHHAKVCSGAMISKAVERAAAVGLREEELYPLTDETFLVDLERFLSARGERGAAGLVAAVRARRLLKRAFVLSGAGAGAAERDRLIARFSRPAARAEFERRVAAACGAREEEVIVHCPPALPLKEADVPVRHRGGVAPLSALDAAAGGEIAALRQQYEGLWRFYVFAPEAVAARACQAVEGWLGLRSEFRRASAGGPPGPAGA